MTDSKYPLKYKLDEYEQEIEDNFGKGEDLTTPEFLREVREASRQHIRYREEVRDDGKEV